MPQRVGNGARPGGAIRVMHLINGLDVGGAEMMLFKVATRTPRDRVEPFVVSVLSEGVVGGMLGRAGVPVTALGKRPGSFDPRMVWRVRRLLERRRPHVLQTHMYEANFYGTLAALGTGAPVVWGIRCSDMDRSRYRFRTSIPFVLNRLLSVLPKAIIANSEAGRRYHVAKGYDGRRMVVVPNGFQTDEFRPDPCARPALLAELGIPTDALLVGRAGRFDPMKDFASFVRAAGVVASLVPRAWFVLAGEGVTHDNADLSRWVYEAGVAGRTRLLGLRDDMPRLLAALAVAVSSSAFGEGFPNVVGEAMSCGVPCVVTDVGDSAEVVGDAGVVVPPSRPGALAEGIMGILAMSEEERGLMGLRARLRIVECYGIGRTVELTLGVYGEVARPPTIARVSRGR